MSTARVPFRPRLRLLGLADLDRIMEIERDAYPYPWTRTIFADCIRVGYDCTGLFLGSTLCGYSIQTQAAGESHLLNLCIAPAAQHQGYGSLLLAHAIRLAKAQACAAMYLEVRPSNAAGVALYRRFGFSVVGTRRDYYRAEKGREDAIVMRLELTDASSQSAAGRPAWGPRDPF